MAYVLKQHKLVQSICPSDVDKDLPTFTRLTKKNKSGFVSFKSRQTRRNNSKYNQYQCTYIHKTANLSADLLQYLFHNDKLSVNIKNGRVYLFMKDDSIPIINQTRFPPDDMENLKEYTTLKFANIFDSAGMNESNLDYNTAVAKFREEPLKMLNTKLYSKDENGVYITGYKIHCKTFLKKHRSDKINKYVNVSYNDENGIDDKLNIIYYLWDNMVETAKIFLDDRLHINPTNINPINYLLQYEKASNKYKLKDKVIMEKIGDSEEYLLLGYPANISNMLLHDKEIMKDGKYEAYREVIDDQTANYKDYMASFLKEDGQYDELIRDVSFNEDIEYLNTFNILGEDTEKFIINLKNIMNNYLMDGEYFNIPNLTFEYSWYILKYSRSQINPGQYDIEPALFHIREVNAKHTPIFKRIQELSRTKLLELYGLKSTKSLFIYTDLTTGLNFKCIYMHPLNILFRNVYFYHKIITIEDIIHTSSLLCDGVHPDMVKYKDMPFWSVIPLEIVSASTMKLDSFIIKNKEIKRVKTKTFQSKQTQNKQTQKNVNSAVNNTVITREEIEILNSLLNSLLNNKNIKVIIANRNQFDTYIYITFLDISNPNPKERICYNAIFEINFNDDVVFDNYKIRRYKKLMIYNDNYNSTDIYGLNGALCKLISISKPINPINIPKTFDFKGFIQIYRQYNGMNTILKQNQIMLLDGTKIENPFKFHFLIITRFIYNMFNIINGLKSRFEREEYLIKGILETDNILRENEFLNDSLSKYHIIIKTTNFIGLLVEFTKDIPKSQSIYKKYELKGLKNFKYTLWIIPYNNVMDIFDKLSKTMEKNETIDDKNIVEKLLNIDSVNLQTKLFNITCVDTPDKINDLIRMNIDIKKYICNIENINEYELSINLNEVSNLEESNLHFHYERKYTYYKPQTSLDTLANVSVDEDKDKKVSIYKYPTSVSGHFSVDMILNKINTNNQYCYNKSLYNNFNGLFKYSGILTLEPLSNL